jgi:hypothetical protein
MNDSAKAEKTKPPLKQRLLRLALLALAALAVILLIWIPVSDMITDARHEDALRDVRDRATMELDTRTRILLATLADALRPGLTDALASGHSGQLRTYVLSVQGTKQIRLVTVADPSGMILVSTDSRLEGSVLQQTFLSLSSSLTEALVDTTSAEVYRIILPIRRNDARLGTAVVECDFAVR